MSSLLNSATNLSGTQTVDRAKRDQIILEASIGTLFYENEKRKANVISHQITVIKKNLERFNSLPEVLQNAARVQGDSFVRRVSSRYCSDSIYLHLDMDMFFCAIEARDNPMLADVPMAVGGISMISTANYHARKFGVRAAMPGFIALKLCPELIFVKPNYEKYMSVAKLFKQVLSKYDPNLRAMSCDEASINLTSYLGKHHIEKQEEIEKLVHEIRLSVREITNGLTCSAGIGPSRILAKICSEINKPNGQTYLDPKNVNAFMNTFPVRNVPGIGKCRERLLEEGFGIRTCGDLVTKAMLILQEFSRRTAESLIISALGLDALISTPISRKSFSCERTFTSTRNKNDLKCYLNQICQSLSEDLLKCDKSEARQLTVKMKLSDFSMHTIGRRLCKSIKTKDEILQIASKLMFEGLATMVPRLNNGSHTKDPTSSGVAVRLLGVRIAELQPNPRTNPTSIIAYLPHRDPLNSSKFLEMDNCKGAVAVKDFTDSPEQLVNGSVNENATFYGSARGEQFVRLHDNHFEFDELDKAERTYSHQMRNRWNLVSSNNGALMFLKDSLEAGDKHEEATGKDEEKRSFKSLEGEDSYDEQHWFGHCPGGDTEEQGRSCQFNETLKETIIRKRTAPKPIEGQDELLGRKKKRKTNTGFSPCRVTSLSIINSIVRTSPTQNNILACWVSNS